TATWPPGFYPLSLHDALPISRGRVRRHEVVVMQVDSVGAQFGQLVNAARGRDRGPHRFAERIPARVADGPEAEREVVLRTGRVGDRKSTRLNSSHVAISYAVF